MLYYKYLFLLIPVILFSGCGISQRVSELQSEAGEAYDNEKFEEALFYYEEIIDLKNDRGHDVSGNTYYNAGMAAYETGHNRKTIEYLQLAHRNNHTTERSYYILATTYRKIDNLSLEITNLEAYNDNYPEGERIGEVRKRLFETYLESNNHDNALEIWPLIENMAKEHPGLLEGYFMLNKRLDREEKLEDIAHRLLAIDRDNKTALEYIAEKTFWEAENRYQQEMKAYEQEKTRRQYRQLLDALDEINDKLRTARDYFERLYENEQDPQYATYLMNIYIRFGNDERAEYYRRRAN